MILLVSREFCTRFVVGIYPAAEPIEEETVRIGDVIIISYTNLEEKGGSSFNKSDQ